MYACLVLILCCVVTVIMLGSGSARKKWNLHDGPRGSLRRLRNQLAEDGCAESQVHLAKQLLEEPCDLEADRISNFKQAMEWLICATEQGHKEARSMLGRCVQSGVLSNQLTVMVKAKSCLNASQQETAAKKAARDLFASLSNGEEYITSAQLEKKIREIWNLRRIDDNLSSEEESLDEDEDHNRLSDGVKGNGGGNALEPSSSHRYNGIVGDESGNQLREEYRPSSEDNHIRNISEENLISAAITYCQGRLPLLNFDLALTEPSLRALDQLPYLHRAFLHPIIFIQILYARVLQYFANFSYRLSNLQILLLVLVHTFFGTDNMLLFFPIIFYYVSFSAMIIFTFKMLHSKREFIDFRKWSGLFLRYSDGNLDSHESEQQYVKNNLKPYLKFFIAVLINVSLYPLVSASWIPPSEFAIVSLCLTFMTLFCFSSYYTKKSYPDLLSFVSFAINVLAKYPYEEDTVVNQGWRFLDLQIQTFPSYLIGNGVEFCLNSRTIFYLLIPAILISMARRERWHGIYKYAIPHCVVIGWLQICIINSQGATMYGLMRGVLALVGISLFLPIMGVTTILLPVFAIVKMITLPDALNVVSATAGGALVILFITCLLVKFNILKNYISPFQIFIGIVTIAYLLTPQIQKFHTENMTSMHVDETESDGFSKFLTESENYHLLWDDYQTHCHSAAWEKSNTAATQIKCLLLDGTKISWYGFVVDARITRVENRWKTVVDKLPRLLREKLECYFGERHKFRCEQKKGDDEKECNFLENVVNKENRVCHLHNYDKYEHEITVRMESGVLLKKTVEISLKAEHHFTNFTQKLKPNDKIHFRGHLDIREALSSACSSPKPVVSLHEVSCLSCHSRELRDARVALYSMRRQSSDFSVYYRNVVNDLFSSAKYVLNFIFNPVFIFK